MDAIEQERRVFDAIANVRVDIAGLRGAIDVVALQVSTTAGLTHELDRRVTALEGKTQTETGFRKGLGLGWVAAAALGGGGATTIIAALLRGA
jgi:hypothetical protein